MAAVFVFLAAAFIGWNEILNSTVATIVVRGMYSQNTYAV